MKVNMPTNQEVGCAIIALTVDKLKLEQENKCLREKLVEVQRFNIEAVKKHSIDIAKIKSTQTNGEQVDKNIVCALPMATAKLWADNLEALSDFLDPIFKDAKEIKLNSTSKITGNQALSVVNQAVAKLRYNIGMIEQLGTPVPLCLVSFDGRQG